MNARKKRKDRKQTQGVPTDVMEQISKHKEHDSSTASTLNTSSDADQDVTSDSNYDNSTEENSPEQRKRTSSGSKVSYDSSDGSSDRNHKDKDNAGSRAIMSSYKPRTRPSSKILMNAVSLAQQQSSRESGKSSSAPPSKMAEVVEQKMRANAAIKSQGG